MGMSILKQPRAINIWMMADDEIDFYVDMYLDYARNVDEMALQKKKDFLRDLLKDRQWVMPQRPNCFDTQFISVWLFSGFGGY